MPWTRHKMVVADENLELRLMGAFKRAFQRAGRPEDVAVFRERLGARGATYYFSPAAANVAADALSEMGVDGGPVACDRPKSTTEQIVGGPEVWRRLFDDDGSRR